jgi:hypothetical protein
MRWQRHRKHRASALAIENGAVPIDVSLRKSVIEALGSVQCNVEQALETSYLIGTGPPLPIYSAWMAAYSTAEATFKYFASTSRQAKQQLQSFDEHFGATGDGLEEKWYAAINDVALAPVIIYALGPGVSARSRRSASHTHALVRSNSDSHVLGMQGTTCRSWKGWSWCSTTTPSLPSTSGMHDIDAVRAMTMRLLTVPQCSDITAWDDVRIKAINVQEVADALPSQPIRVVIQSVASAITRLFTTLLNDTVPQFADRVGAGPLVRFPIASSNTTTLVRANEAIIRALAAKAYSFAIITQYDAVLVRHWAWRPLLRSTVRSMIG